MNELINSEWVRRIRGEVSDEEVASAIRSVPEHRGAATYIVYNSAMATTAAPVKQPTGNAIRTMMQLRFATGIRARIIEWGCSFDGSAAATPGQIELVEVDVAATMTTAYAAADVQLYNNFGAAQTAGAAGVPLNLSTITSGFATAAVTEGTTTVSRMADLQMVAPTGQYVHQWPLGREFEVAEQKYLRVRVTFGTSINMWSYIVFEL